MAERGLLFDLFVEDPAQERFLAALVQRVANEERKRCTIRTVLAKGGHGRVLTELDLFVRTARVGAPNAVVVGIDANCKGWTAARRAAQDVLEGSGLRAVIACPDPHIERWYLGDTASLSSTFGVKVAVPRRKCDRDAYKQLLVRALMSGDNLVTLGGIEYADEIVACMDLFRAGKAEPSFRHFIDDLRAVVRTG